MATQRITQTTTDKILSSDIYDITAFVDDIKKANIDGVDSPEETLQVGMYGYLGYEFASLLQNAIVVSSELANEAIPTRAKFDRNVITHALSLGIKKVHATAASMKVMLIFPERALNKNMVDGKFVFKASTPIYFNDMEFHTDYDIIVNKTLLDSSTIGSRNINYVYTAIYDMTVPNVESEIDNAYLPPVSIFADGEDNMVVLITTLHQVEHNVIEKKIVGNDELANKTLSFSFENQLSHFTVTVYENNDRTNPIVLTPYYDGLYHDPYNNPYKTRYQYVKETISGEIIKSFSYEGKGSSEYSLPEDNTKVYGIGDHYCYYQYINSNTIRIRFDPHSYQPRTNANVEITVWTSHGYEGNFDYKDDLMVRLTSDEYTNLYMIVKQRGDQGSYGGLDRKTVPELQKIIPKEALSRGCITTLTDLRNYFNSINNEDSVLHVFRKEDNILTRVYYVYSLMKDIDNNIVPTNTIPVYKNGSSAEAFVPDSEKLEEETRTGDMYIQAGDPIYYYKDKLAPLSWLANNWIGYFNPSNSVDSNIVYTNVDPSITPHLPVLYKYIRQFLARPEDYGNDFGRYVVENEEFANAYPNIHVFEPGSAIQFSCIPKYNDETNMFRKADSYTGTVVRMGYYGDDPNDPEQMSPWGYGTTPTDNTPVYLKIVVNAVNDNQVMEQVTLHTAYNSTWSYPHTNIIDDPVYEFATYSIYSKSHPFSTLSVQKGSHILFCRYKEGEDVNTTLSDPDNWVLGEVLNTSKKADYYTSLNVYYHENIEGVDVESLVFNTETFRIPTSTDLSSFGTGLQKDHIIGVRVLSNFVYTSPLNIVLRDNDVVGSHRVDAAYYLDVINESRLFDFECINSASPLQYISSYVSVKRPSWISSDRHKYYIDVEITPNIGNVTDEMVARTQVIGVYYGEDGVTNPIAYSIGKLVSNIDNVLKYRFYLYTKPFKARTDPNHHERLLDDQDRMYIGPDNPYNEIATAKITETQQKLDEENAKPDPDPDTIALLEEDLAYWQQQLTDCTEFIYDPNYSIFKPCNDGVRMALNTTFRIYTLYKYADTDKYGTDELTFDFFKNSQSSRTSIVGTPLTHIMPETVQMPIPKIGDKEYVIEYQDENDETQIERYTLGQMSLTNVYQTHDGINLMYNYSHLMNSYVTMLVRRSSEGYTDDIKKNPDYIVNRVPVIRYFYLGEEIKIKTFITEMKRKILYVLDALDPLECTFGLDYKFFNSYGPSKMYHLIDYAGNTGELIDNVALSVTFRTKFYNEDNDAASIIPQIKNDIKAYMENIEELNDLHFPNLTTEIENKYGEYIIYFEYVGFNKYNATEQHIITDENMEMLTVVPEFLNINVDDSTGLPYINIEVVK